MMVSVIMPCRDHGRFLDDAVESIHAQTLQDFELLIVDDGSTDPETVDRLERLGHDRARVFRREHRGVTAARNYGLREARGRYVTFIDSDDRIDPQFLECTVGALEADASLGFASTWVRVFGDQSWDWTPESCEFPWLLHDCSVPPSALVRRSLALEIGGFDESMELGHEDWDFWLRVVERGHPGTIIPRALLFYRRAGPSRSTIIDRGATYLELYRDLARRHEASFRAHYFDLLWLKESIVDPHLRLFGRLHSDLEFERERLRRAEAAAEAALVACPER